MGKTMMLPISGSDQVLEVELSELMKDEKAAEAIRNGNEIWIENFTIKANGDAVFDLKIYYPN